LALHGKYAYWGSPTLGDDSQSTVSVQLSLPHFTGGLCSANMQQAFETLEQLRLQRLSTRPQGTQQDHR